ncbi:DUF2470 domain-containing protein [Homoserinibacter sp. YIM 151385]|uniref:DUF2470 domain-containing protein n=1 Tax=Homoserinibacter sp. YIM 151385 TaxID=2985506 RepID=UPI0022F0E46E|nr:DUF2470 domain-containing protein [Homoserinibacter sp. YIM 151385]WBU37062.1 DUF2470 domain-containing protein [Homoserinibacter sp. YIM 151385]
MSRFEPEVATAVLRHMNEDHGRDSLQIVQAHGAPEAIAASMVDLDREAGVWDVVEPEGGRTLRVAWPIEVRERADLRRAVVELHRIATGGNDPRHRAAEQTEHPHHAETEES